MNEELRTITDHFWTTLSSEVGKQLTLMSSTVKTMEDKIKQATSYRDAILGHNKALKGTDPKIVARAGIRARQFVIDFPAGLAMQNLSQTEVLRQFNEALAKAGGENGEEKHRV